MARLAVFFQMVVMLLCAFAPSAIAQGAPELRVETLYSADAVAPGGSIEIAVRAQLPEGWHTNAHEPLEDYLIPTRLTLDLPAEFRVVKIVYPEAKRLRLSFSDSELAVYETNFVIGVVLEATSAAAPGEVNFSGSLRYQACSDTQCAPPKTVPVPLRIRVAAQGQTPVPENTELFATLALSTAQAAAPSDSVNPTPGPEPVKRVAEGDTWRRDVEAFTVANVGAFMTPSQFLQFLDEAESGRGRGGAGLFEGRTLGAVLLLTLLGGLLLNLTPCVLPLIPINVAIIGAGARAGSKAQGFALGATYGLGIALVYGALGLFVVLAGATFGAINASPWFNLTIAVLFAALALAMFDVFLIDFTRYQARLGGRKKGGYFAAFFMGGVSALLAGACVAPVVIAVLLFSQDLYAKGHYGALALPFLLGAGMALPWPFAGAGLSFLPKPGRWMDRVKYGFGVLILALAAYYGYTAYGLFSQRNADPAAVTASVAALEQGGWRSSLDEGLAKARAEKKPVLIDFWATWCKNCKVMNETTFKNPDVQRRLDGYVKVKYQAEDPDSPPHKEILERFDIVGLPGIVVLRPNTAD